MATDKSLFKVSERDFLGKGISICNSRITIRVMQGTIRFMFLILYQTDLFFKVQK